MCEHGTTRLVKLNTPRPVSKRIWVPVDACIADEVQRMNDLGIVTLGSCCGHGEEPPPHVLADEENGLLALNHGYQVAPCWNGLFKIQI